MNKCVPKLFLRLMKKKIIVIYFFLSFFYPLEAALKDEIILNLKKTNNLTFDFKQTIDKKTEKGSCIIEYPKKIYCLYDNFNKKIMVSNGKSLVIKNQTNNQFYLYPLKKTPLELILDKNYVELMGTTLFFLDKKQQKCVGYKI